MQARHEALKSDVNASFALLHEDMISQISQLREDWAKRNAEIAKRDRDNTRWIIASILGGISIVVVTLGIIIRWPA